MEHTATAGGNAVVAVRYGEWHTQRSQVYLNYSDLGELDGPHTVAYYFWVITTPHRTIVVDTGFEAATGARRGRETLIAVPDAFAQLGLTPDSDVDLVLTHAHYDHIGNVAWFRCARVLMARPEYDFWRSDLATAPTFAGLVEQAELRHLVHLHESGRLELVDHELELAPGVRLVLAPGHTPGELMVLVDTDDGRVLLTSDAVHFDEELTRDMPFRHMCDLVQSHAAFASIRAMAATGEVAHVIAGHEPDVSERYRPVPLITGGRAVIIAGDPITTHTPPFERKAQP